MLSLTRIVHNIPNKIVKRPFFTWKSTASLSQVDVTAGVIKVLNRIIKLLLKERTSKLHQDGFTCTLADLQARQISSGVVGELSDVKKSFADGNGNDNGSQHGTVAEQSKIPSFSSEPNTSTQNNDSTVKDAPDSIHESSSDTSETSTTNDSQVTLVDARYGRLIEVTNLFLEDFIPGKGDATTHKLVQSLWGFVDAILRVRDNAQKQVCVSMLTNPCSNLLPLPFDHGNQKNGSSANFPWPVTSLLSTSVKNALAKLLMPGVLLRLTICT